MLKVAAVVASLLVLSACSSELVAPGTRPIPGSPLIDPFKSFMTHEEVVDAMPKGALVKESGADASAARGDCPARTWRNLEVSGWRDRGVKGTLGLSFYNDRLASTEFRPADFQRYLDALRADGIDLTGGDGSVEPRTAISALPDAEGGPVVSWFDEVLRDQDRDWIFSCA